MIKQQELTLEELLSEVKRVIAKHSADKPTWILVTRDKNIQAIIDLGMTLEEVGLEISTLSVGNYRSGPEPDSTVQGDVLTFLKQIRGQEVYIKLKLSEDKRDSMVRVVSFHVSPF